MIVFEEKITTKIPGLTSFYITFNFNQLIVDSLKTVESATYLPKTKEWEIPITSLSDVVNKICIYDEISIKLLKEKIREEEKQNINLKEFNTKPFDYQLEGVQFGLNINKWLLLDPPGLGKTLQILLLAKQLKETKNIEHCLIICGLNTLKANWEKEIKKHTNLSCTILGQKTNSKGKVYIGSVAERVAQLNKKIEEYFIITNIETLRNDNIVKAINKGKNNFDMIVVDEIHQCKSPNSIQGKHLLKLNNALYKIGATGTLLLNNPMDAYVPLKWIGVEKSNYSTFRYYYCKYGGSFNNILLGFKNLKTLKFQLDKCSLRRSKDLLNLPPKTIINEFVDMDEKQATFYDNVKNGIKSEVDKVHLDTTSILAMVGRLRQATACPSILTSDEIESAKIERACDLTEQIINNGNKVVIFSTFKETVNELEKKLFKYNPLICMGGVKDTVISENIDQFQKDDRYKVFIGTWQKCGTGITLTEASYMIFIDTPWTYAVFEQASDRIHRIGTYDPVFIYNLIARNTVDETVLSIMENKKIIADYVVDDKVPDQDLNKLKTLILDL